MRCCAAGLVSLLLGSIALGLPSAMAEDRKGIRFWNLTLHTITHLRMSPAGENMWGPDQCRNDRHGSHLEIATGSSEKAANTVGPAGPPETASEGTVGDKSVGWDYSQRQADRWRSWRSR